MSKEKTKLLFIQWIIIISLVTGCTPSIGTAETLPTKSVVTARPLITHTAAGQTPTIGATTVRPKTTREKDGMNMILIEAGEFSIGSEMGEPDERPVHKVSLDAYWIDETEVTNAMYAACVKAGACRLPMEMGSYTRDHYYDSRQFSNYPVIHLDWTMAETYCKWAEARLPSEAEWEMAAGGSRGSIYPWGNEWDVVSIKRLNFADRNNPEAALEMSADDGFADTSPVGSFPGGQSVFGLYDMAGNVWEWIADWYDPAYYATSPANNPTGPNEPPLDLPEMRVLRGGSWVASQNVFRIANRNGLEPSKSSSSIGFRCAR